MKISSPRNIFDLFYLDILENSMENILFLNCGEECRSLTCFLQQYVCEQEDASTFSAIEGRSFDQLHLYHYKQTGPSSVMSDIEKTQCGYSTSPSVNNFHLSIYLLINTLVLNYLQLTALTDF